jgi:hypothetical protein
MRENPGLSPSSQQGFEVIEMDVAGFVIAIMGCTDGGYACTQVATLPARYDSERACFAATVSAAELGGRYDYPTTMAQCQPAAGTRSVRSAPRITDGGRSG